MLCDSYCGLGRCTLQDVQRPFFLEGVNMHVGKPYPLAIIEKRRAAMAVSRDYPRRWLWYAQFMMGTRFVPLIGRTYISGLHTRAADGQSCSWEWEFPEMPTAMLRITHHLVEIPPAGSNIRWLNDFFLFEMFDNGVLYGSRDQIIGQAVQWHQTSMGHPGLTIHWPWTNILDPAEFDNPTSWFSAGLWADSPEWKPYVTKP